MKNFEDEGRTNWKSKKKGHHVRTCLIFYLKSKKEREKVMKREGRGLPSPELKLPKNFVFFQNIKRGLRSTC